MSSRLDQLNRLLAATPDDVEVRYMVAMEHKSAGDHAAAVRVFDDCIARQPSYTPAYFQKANTLLAAGDPDAGAEALRTGIIAARQSGDHHAADEMQALLDTL